MSWAQEILNKKLLDEQKAVVQFHTPTYTPMSLCARETQSHGATCYSGKGHNPERGKGARYGLLGWESKKCISFTTTCVCVWERWIMNLLAWFTEPPSMQFTSYCFRRDDKGRGEWGNCPDYIKISFFACVVWLIAHSQAPHWLTWITSTIVPANSSILLCCCARWCSPVPWLVKHPLIETKSPFGSMVMLRKRMLPQYFSSG